MALPFFSKQKETILPESIYGAQPIGIKDIVAPAAIEITSGYLKLGDKLAKSFFVFSFPRYLSAVWLSPIINLNTPLDISLVIYPIDVGDILRQLRKRVAEVQAEIMDREEKGLVRDPELEIAYRDMEELRDKLQTAQEKVFHLGVYLTIFEDTEEKLRQVETDIRSILESRLIYIKPALFQQREGFITTLPYGLDLIQVYTPLNTAPLSSIFPFVSSDLSSNEGILYGINKHNNSLVLFDRFTLENANTVVFGKAGSGKSYLTKLEILRSLMMGAEVIVIDPENEYEFLCDAVGGSFLPISLASPYRINPFDLPPLRKDERPEDVLRSNIINLVGLIRLMLGGLTPEEDAIIDRALTETYAIKDITPESDPAEWPEKTPLFSDLEAILETMEGAESLLRRIQKFTQGTYAGFFNQPTNLSLDKQMVVFAIRDMEESLRPTAMYLVMRYIWNAIRAELKKRILVIDEAWWLMQSEDGASFLYGLAKRARKYWLGVTTVTQDVIDFMKSDYGKPIITNSSLQILMKQSTAGVEILQKTFNLTEAEKRLLVEAPIGEGLFFAGSKHVAIKVVASYAEDQIITTAPEEVLKIQRAKKELTGEI
jgi:type IV secretory pathway VirB4 component